MITSFQDWSRQDS